MAAVASETVTIHVNDVELVVPKGELIVESVKRLGLEIPIFCYHPRMKPVGMCRMCLVEVGFKQPDGSVRKMPKPQAGCTLPASEGMVVYTDTEMVHRDRKGVLEFLLINHPLDCPICDRGGECPLQNNTLFYGPSTSRFVEVKRHNHKAFPLSKYVTLDLERCIQCGRCVRFTEEISGDAELAFRFRGAEMQPSTYELRDFTSKFSGNVIEICPVGALTNREYRFRARPWDLQTQAGICTLCSNGCNIWMDHRVGKFVRVNGRTHEGINEEWTCDKGKFGHDFYNGKRLSKPLRRSGDRLVECDWPEAYAEIVRAFSAGGEKVALLAGGMIPNEGLYLMKRLFADFFGSSNLDARWTQHLPKAHQSVAAMFDRPNVQGTIAGLEDKRAIVVFGTSLADDSPIVFLRARKAWFKHGTQLVVISDQPTDADSFAHLIVRYQAGQAAAAANGLLAAAVENGAQVPDATRAALPSVEEAATIAGVEAHDLRAAAQMLGAEAALLTSTSLYDQAGGQEATETLAGLSMVSGSQFYQMTLAANDQGAMELGFGPGESGKNTHEILQAARDGKIEALWLLGADPFTLHPDRELVTAALENVPFLVIEDVQESEAFGYGSVVLPLAAPAEAEGSFTNVERRVQKQERILTAPGEAKAAWKIASEVMVRIQPRKPYFSADEVLAEIAECVPAFADCAQPGAEGAFLK